MLLHLQHLLGHREPPLVSLHTGKHAVVVVADVASVVVAVVDDVDVVVAFGSVVCADCEKFFL